MRGTCVALMLAGVIGSGCDRPEARRTRGDGPGADVGNRARVVHMHEGSQPFWQTPAVAVGRHPSLEPAQQARDFELRQR
jgi:hypothetical protein